MTLKPLHKDFYEVENLVFTPCGFNVTDLNVENESQEYGACTYKLNNKFIHFRVSKITPTKIGQFVSIWKRNGENITEPFDVFDKIDFIIITARKDDNFGLFIFPKSILVEKGIIKSNNKAGKRGIRVYAAWDIVENKQAKETQSWQKNYFFTIINNDLPDLDFIRKLLT
jgi:hypothetical protein